ncbi:Homocysteine S-methyltransferase 4 [Glycine max]|nr:Homocysteine S-methyltransferase 4 [Glycine max]
MHREKVKILVEAGADLIAFETIPNKLEAQACAELLEEEGIETPAWFSFSCNDESNVVSGDYIFECASIAVIHADKSLQLELTATSKPVLVYPNSGETYIAESNQWVMSSASLFLHGPSLFLCSCLTNFNLIAVIINDTSHQFKYA